MANHRYHMVCEDGANSGPAWYADGIHPNDAGHAALAGVIGPALRGLMV